MGVLGHIKVQLTMVSLSSFVDPGADSFMLLSSGVDSSEEEQWRKGWLVRDYMSLSRDKRDWRRGKIMTKRYHLYDFSFT